MTATAARLFPDGVAIVVAHPDDEILWTGCPPKLSELVEQLLAKPAVIMTAGTVAQLAAIVIENARGLLIARHGSTKGFATASCLAAGVIAVFKADVLRGPIGQQPLSCPLLAHQFPRT